MITALIKAMIAAGCIVIPGTSSVCTDGKDCFLMKQSDPTMFALGYDHVSFSNDDKAKLKEAMKEVEDLKKKIAHDEKCEKLGIQLMGELK